MMTRVRKKIIKGEKEEELVVLDRDETTLGSAAQAEERAQVHGSCTHASSPHRHSTLFKENYNLKFGNKSNFVKFS